MGVRITCIHHQHPKRSQNLKDNGNNHLITSAGVRLGRKLGASAKIKVPSARRWGSTLAAAARGRFFFPVDILCSWIDRNLRAAVVRWQGPGAEQMRLTQGNGGNEHSTTAGLGRASNPPPRRTSTVDSSQQRGLALRLFGFRDGLWAAGHPACYDYGCYSSLDACTLSSFDRFVSRHRWSAPRPG
jgi:hypothetical protein